MEELKKEFISLYEMMAKSNDVSNMHTFGNVHKEMMEWMIANKPELAKEWIEKLESIKWKNYLTPKEAEHIVADDKLFDAVYELAVDKLTDEDGRFNVRDYFSL